MMRDWQANLGACLKAGRGVVLVTCVEVKGSAPCAAGSRMLVEGDGFRGTIGGGNLEFLALAQARKLLASEERCLRQSLPLGPLLSQCCGGRVTLIYERFSPADLAFVEAIAASDGTILTRCDPDTYGKWLIEGSGVRALTGSLVLSSTPAMPEMGFDDPFFTEAARIDLPQVCIFGAGHIGEALAKVLDVAPCKIMLIDSRDDIAPAIPEQAEWVRTDDPQTLPDWWEEGAIALVLTHSHELDFAWVSAILQRGDSQYCGLIGSRTKRQRFIRRLLAQGLSQQQVAHLTCPIGAPELKSKDPGAVAIAAAAQILPFLTVLPRLGAGRGCACDASGILSSPKAENAF